LGKLNFAPGFTPLKSLKGFTLIEMMVAVGILGVMAAAMLAVLNPFSQFQKANDTKRKTDLSQISKALESYYQDNQKYPASSNFKISDPKQTPNERSWGSSWRPYMNVIPKDPSGSKNYVYSVSADGQTYYLYASLDKGITADQCHGASPCGSATACGSGTCNYGIASPDVTP
jgi:type II secretion system protein G